MDRFNPEEMKAQIKASLDRFIREASHLEPEELERRAREDLNCFLTWNFDAEFCGQAVGPSERLTVDVRLDAYEALLGEERFRTATADIQEKWQRAFAEAREFEATLSPCVDCGGQRGYADAFYKSEYCGDCQNEQYRQSEQERNAFIRSVEQGRVVELSPEDIKDSP